MTLLDENGSLYQSPNEEIIQFNVHYPREFKDLDFNQNVYSFHGLRQECSSAYKIKDGKSNKLDTFLVFICKFACFMFRGDDPYEGLQD